MKICLFTRSANLRTKLSCQDSFPQFAWVDKTIAEKNLLNSLICQKSFIDCSRIHRVKRSAIFAMVFQLRITAELSAARR